MIRFPIVLLLTLCSSVALQADDWPQFLGLRRDGSSHLSVKAWKDSPKELWKKPVG
jgi:hypothetical protein